MNPIFFSGLLLIAIVYIALRIAPREKEEHAHIHGAGQIGLLAALALFGVDYFTSYYYATGELMSALHPYGMQNYAWIAVSVIAFANAVFGFLYMYSLGVFNEGGGSYTASMRYLSPGLKSLVAVVLIQDYVFTIVVSSLSGVDQLLSITNAYNTFWFWRFLLGALLAGITWSYHPWSRLIGKGSFYRFGNLRFPDYHHGDWPFHRQGKGSSTRALYRAYTTCNFMGSHISHADRFNERSRGFERSGSHV